MSPAQLGYKLDEVARRSPLLIGRVTYESFAGAWPKRTGEFADKKTVLRLEDTRTFPSGVVVHAYRPASARV
jgi:dihydrofolate reductase